MKQIFLDIILPVPLPGFFTYHVNHELQAEVDIGKRVVVPFGKTRHYSGIIAKVHHEKPEQYKTKAILSILDETPVVHQEQIKFWAWVASYYQCTLGEVYKAALPSGLKLESESRIVHNPDFQADSPLHHTEGRLLDIVASGKQYSIQEINQLSGLKNSLPALKRLLDMGAIYINEHLKESYKPKFEKQVSLHENICSEKDLKEALETLKRAPKQESLLLCFIMELGGVDAAIQGASLARHSLLAKLNVSTAILNELSRKQIIDQHDVETGRLNKEPEAIEPVKKLTEEQQRSFREITESFQQKEVTLLHGVTSSGKTEIYIHLIDYYLSQKKQVLYLLPEIALTTQITTRLKRHFGHRLGIFHSRFSDAERVEVWNNLLQNKGYEVILGVRSSIFLPFSKLGLVIVDEEHETSYKQFDPAPRYHARDAAMVLGAMHGAKMLLGTGTPSMETYFNCQQKKFGLVELFERYQGIKMPKVLPVNTREAYRKKQMKSHFHPDLITHMEDALNNDEQVILFQNRRGFAPFVECRLCAWVPKCDHCDVSLTYHKHLNQLVCHYCSHAIFLPEKCPACGSGEVETRGFGTEKIEEEIKHMFPDVKVSRMDLDTTRSKKSYEQIIGDFEQKKVQILIGTQMISKGLDFDSVSVVGI